MEACTSKEVRLAIVPLYNAPGFKGCLMKDAFSLLGA